MKNWSLLWIPLLSIVVRNDWYLVAVYERFQGFATECMQFAYGTVLGIVCVFGHYLSNEYELDVHNAHINEMDCYILVERKNILYLRFLSIQ